MSTFYLAQRLIKLGRGSHQPLPLQGNNRKNFDQFLFSFCTLNIREACDLRKDVETTREREHETPHSLDSNTVVRSHPVSSPSERELILCGTPQPNSPNTLRSCHSRKRHVSNMTTDRGGYVSSYLSTTHGFLRQSWSICVVDTCRRHIAYSLKLDRYRQKKTSEKPGVLELPEFGIPHKGNLKRMVPCASKPRGPLSLYSIVLTFDNGY